MPPHGRRARPALARLRPLHGPLGPGPAQARLHTVRPHMATLGPVTHLTSRLLTLRWLGTLRGLSPLSLAARMLLTPLTPLCAVRRSHWAGLLRRRSPHPAHAALLRIPLPTIALACYTALTSPSLRVGPARPGLTADPTLSLSPHTLRWPVPARHSAQGSPYAPLLLTSHAVSRQRAAPGCLPGSGPGQARPYTYSHTRPGSTWPARPARSRPAPARSLHSRTVQACRSTRLRGVTGPGWPGLSPLRSRSCCEHLAVRITELVLHPPKESPSRTLPELTHRAAAGPARTGRGPTRPGAHRKWLSDMCLTSLNVSTFRHSWTLFVPTTQALVPNPFISAWLRPASARLSGLISGRDDDGVCE